MTSPSFGQLDDLIRHQRSLRRRLWLLLGLATVSLCGLLALLVPLGVRFPAASVPAILGSAFGYYRGRRRGLGWAATPTGEGLSPLQGFTLVYGTLAGATGYAALAAFRIGVPAPEAPLGWRLIGGLVFGAIAGIVAGGLAPLLELVTLFRRRKRAA